MIVRAATVEDIPAMVDLSLQFYEESRLKDVPFEIVTAQGFALTFNDLLTGTIPNGIIFVVEEKSQMIGLIAGMAQPHYFNRQKLIAHELLWWVHPNYRKTRAALLLYKHFLKWKKEIKANYSLMGSLGSFNSEKVNQFYTKRGYTLVERLFVKEV